LQIDGDSTPVSMICHLNSDAIFAAASFCIDGSA
jgi:hypothetical protein